jgi:hypothetical protein
MSGKQLATILAAMAVGVATISLVIVATNRNEPAVATRQPSQSTGSPSHSPAAKVVTATLTVQVLKSELGVSENVPKYPSKVRVRISSVWAHKVTAYGVAGVVLLAPSGWKASEALIGANGSASASLHGAGLASRVIPGRLEYEETSASGWSSWQGAAQYFNSVLNDWSSSPYANDAPPMLRPGLKVHYIGDRLIAYSVHSGAEVDLGFRVDGAAHTLLPEGNTASEKGPLFDRLEIVLPPGYPGLATAILNNYIARYHG